MGVQFDIIENVIEFDESCTVEDAETLLQLVLEHDDALIAARHAIVAHHALVWPTSITNAEKSAAIAQLKTLGVLVRQGA